MIDTSVVELDFPYLFLNSIYLGKKTLTTREINEFDLKQEDIFAVKNIGYFMVIGVYTVVVDMLEQNVYYKKRLVKPKFYVMEGFSNKEEYFDYLKQIDFESGVYKSYEFKFVGTGAKYGG